MVEKDALDKLQAEAQRAKVSEIQVKTFMNRNLIKIREGTKIYSAVQTLATHKISGAPVVNANDQLIGIISEYDLLLQTALKDVLQPIEYTKNPVTVTPETAIKDVIIIFYKTKVRWLPVVGATHQVEGIVTRLDILNKLLSKGK
ncbi:MAG: CBS domain-containing protein [Bdellovibrionota bacterium]